MSRLSKKKLLEFARRERQWYDIENPRPSIVTKGTGLRFKVMKKEFRKIMKKTFRKIIENGQKEE